MAHTTAVHTVQVQRVCRDVLAMWAGGRRYLKSSSSETRCLWESFDWPASASLETCSHYQHHKPNPMSFARGCSLHSHIAKVLHKSWAKHVKKT
eukprot:2691323-Amphidinium_carterae.1